MHLFFFNTVKYTRDGTMCKRYMSVCGYGYLNFLLFSFPIIFVAYNILKERWNTVPVVVYVVFM